LVEIMKVEYIIPPSAKKEGGFIKSSLILIFIIFFLALFFFTLPSSASFPVIAQIKIEGNKLIKEDEIMKVILNKPGTFFSKEKIKEDMQAIYNMGFFYSVKALKELVPEGVVLIYQVEEYPVVSGVDFVGVEDARAKKKLKEFVTLKEKEPWNYKKAEESKDKILDYFRKEGYTNAKVGFLPPSPKEEGCIAVFSIDKGQRARVMEIEISGNHFFSDPKIRTLMQTKFKGYLDPKILKDDIKKVIEEYQKKGFYFASIDTERFEFFEKYRVRWVRIYLRVNEGKRYKMGDLSIKGNRLFSDSEIKERIRPKKEEIFDTEKLKESIRRIKNMYGEEGYLYAGIDNTLHFNPEKATVDVELSIEEDGQIRVGTIKVEGNERTKWKAFENTLLLNSGDIFNINKMIESWRRLYNLGFFEKVEMQPVETSDPSFLNLLIKVKERERTGKLLLGASYSSNLGWEGFIEFSKDNLWGEGKMLSVDWEFGGRRNDYEIRYLDRWWEDTSTRVELDLYNKEHKFYNENEGYVKNTAGGEISLGRPWFSNFNVFLAFRRETAKISSIEGRVLPEGLKEGEKTYQSLKPSINWDSRVRDEAFNSYEGLYALFSVEKSGGFLGGNVDFTKYSAELKSYFRYGKLWTMPILALRLRGKWGTNLPVDEEFYIGGQDTLRGYRFGEFRGSQALLGTAELRLPVTQNLLTYLFIDAGKTDSLEEYKIGYGFGVKINSPLGPIRLDYGIGEEGQPRFYFGMGDVF